MLKPNPPFLWLRRDPLDSAWAQRECPYLYSKGAVWQRLTPALKSTWSSWRCRLGEMQSWWIRRASSLLQHGDVLPKARLAARVRPVPSDLPRSSQLQELWVIEGQKRLHSHSQVEIWMSPAPATLRHLFTASQAQGRVWRGVGRSQARSCNCPRLARSMPFLHQKVWHRAWDF